MTVTDANVVLGYINPDYFNGGAMRLDAKAAAAAIARQIGDPLGLGVGEAAWGVHTVANANMERAMRIVSVERGRDPRKYALVAFGGAGPLHAARLARALGTPKIIVPYGAGVGSAIGMLEANAKLDASLTRMLSLTPGAEGRIADIYRQLEARISADLQLLGAAAQPAITRFAYLRYAGQGHEIRVDLPEFPIGPEYMAQTVARFEEAYQRKYGYRQPGAAVEAVDWYVVATVANAAAGSHRARSWHAQASSSARRGTRKAYLPELGGLADCAVIERSALGVGELIEGPAIIEEAEATTLLVPGCRGAVGEHGHLVITVGEV